MKAKGKFSEVISKFVRENKKSSAVIAVEEIVGKKEVRVRYIAKNPESISRTQSTFTFLSNWLQACHNI